MTGKKDTIIKNFSKAVERLDEAIKAPATQLNKDATIQRFEFCFELGWKAAQVFLREQGIICKSPKDCFRRAADYGLIKSPEPWFKFLDARNLVSHTYNEKIANQVYRKTTTFPKYARSLLKELESSK